MSEQQNASEGKVKLKVSQILEDLGNGLDRDAIKAKYGLSHNDMQRLFQHEKLKGVRVKKAPSFELEDDIPEPVIPEKKKAAAPKKEKAVATEAAAPVASEVVEETKQQEEDEVTTSATEVTAVETVDAAPGSTIREVTGSNDADADAPVETKKDLW